MGRHIAPPTPATHARNIDAIASATLDYPLGLNGGAHVAPTTLASVEEESKIIDFLSGFDIWDSEGVY